MSFTIPPGVEVPELEYLLDIHSGHAADEPSWHEALSAAAALCRAVRDQDAKYRAERRLRQAADSALAQALRHPNSKLDHVTGYLYRLEEAAGRYDRADTAFGILSDLHPEDAAEAWRKAGELCGEGA